MSEHFINFSNPGLALVLAYFISYIVSIKWRRIFILLAPLATFVGLMMNFQKVYTLWMSFSLLIGLWAGLLFAFDRSKTSTMQFALLYFGAGIAIVLSSNLMMIFVFLELMLVAATFIIFNGSNSSSIPGFNYFKFHVFSGILFLTASLFYFMQYGSFEIDAGAFSSNTFLRLVMLLSLLINLAMPPFSCWLVSGYAASSPVGTIFLAVGITKVTLILMIKMFLGYSPLIYIGFMMSVYGVIYSLLETDVRKNFNYSIICQLGFGVVAVGIGGELGQKAAIFMAISEVLYIALAAMCVSLFISKEFKRDKESLLGTFVAFASIASLPLTPGYVGKFLLYNTPEVMNSVILKYSITLISMGVIFSVAIKIPFMMLSKNIMLKIHSGAKLPRTKIWSLSVLTFIILILGIFPGAITDHDYYFSLRDYLYKTCLFLVVIVSALFLYKKIIHSEKRKLLDADWLYCTFLVRIYNNIVATVVILVKNFDASFIKSRYFVAVLDKASPRLQSQILIVILVVLGLMIIL